MQPRLTIALFCYNQEAYVEESVRSVLAQDYANLEIIISDDCSQDKTFEIIENIVSKYEGIHKNNIILNRNNINLGTGKHVDKIAQSLKTDWLITAAGDDISLPNRCSIVAELILKYPDAKAFGGCYDVIDQYGSIIGSVNQVGDLITSFSDRNWLKDLSLKPEIYGALAAWHSDLFKKFPPIQDVLAEDIILSYRLAILGSIQVVSDRKLILYRKSQSSTTNLDKKDLFLWAHKYSEIFSKCWLNLLNDLLSVRTKLETTIGDQHWLQIYRAFNTELNRCVYYKYVHTSGFSMAKIRWFISVVLARRSSILPKQKILGKLRKIRNEFKDFVFSKDR